MQQGKTIITYLVNWNPNGLKTVEFSNKLIKGISIPRKDFKEAIENRQELKYSGVYFLMGEDEEGNNMTYVWQATVLAKRLNDHYKDINKDFWNNAICFTYKDGSLNESDINYLERAIIYEAKNADRYTIINSTLWNNWLIQEHRISDMVEFVADLKILISNLWHNILTKLINKENHTSEDEIYYLTNRWSNAKWIYTDEGFLVLQWSIWPKDLVESQIKNKYYAFRHRPKLIEKGIIKEEWNYIFFLKDYTFKTPSAAADIILWRSSNWWIDRKTKDWKTLDEIIRKNGNI